LSWELRVWTPNKSTLKATYTDAAPGGIAGGFRWSVRGDGNCEQMRFQAVPSKVDIAARDIVQLIVDGQPAFYGYVETAWPAGDGRLREYVAVGADRLLQQRLMDSRTYTEQDVGAIVRDIASRLLHPAITYDPARVPDTGGILSLSHGFGVDLHRTLTDLAGSVGARWGVDATGTFFFGAGGSATTVGYAERGLRWLPVEGDEIVTRVVLIQRINDRGDILTHTYTDPLHTVYGAEKAFVSEIDLTEMWPAPDSVVADSISVAPEQTADGGASWQNWNGAATFLLDPDPNTGLRSVEPPPEPGSICLTAIKQRGVWLVWNQPTYIDAVQIDAVNADGAELYLFFWWDNGGATEKENIRLEGGISFTGTIELKREVLRVGVGRIAPCSNLGPWDVRVYRLAPLRYGAAVEQHARSLIRLPSQNPAEIEWQGYQPPARYLTVTGAPGGDLTGEVEAWEYEWTPRRMRSVARIGSRGSNPTARAIRILADRRREEAEGTALALTRRR